MTNQGVKLSHPFGDLVSQHLHRKHGLSQSKLAAGILQAPTIVTQMCKGQRLTGPQARERVVAIIGWLHQQGALESLDEANALLDAAGMASLNGGNAVEAALAQALRISPGVTHAPKTIPLARTHNLPASVSALIGREEDVAAATKLLRQDDIRAITLIGPPGVGKTRLALQVALDSHDAFTDGAWFVPLAPVSDPNLVAAAIAQALDLPDVGAPPLAVLKDHLRDKQALLVLDNFEQVLAAASLVAEILAAAPGVKVLVTSRAALHISGEHTLAVPPLAEQAAVELFVRRAQAIRPGFALGDTNRQAVADICKRLDGLPLAIELAAARIRLFEPSVLLARLSSRLGFLTGGSSDLPAHQRTLRGTIDWSYALLTPEEQTLFRRLGAFAGGCTLEAAEQVAGEGLVTPIVDLMQSLADKSLVRVETQDGQPRFSLLEMLREYAVERLEDSGEISTLSRCHADFFITFAERVDPELRGHEQSQWVRRLDAEQDNARAALSWALRTSNVELGLRLAGALGFYWFAGNHQHEGWSWISQLVVLPEAQRLVHLRANALMAAIPLLRHLGDNAQADLIADEALALFRQLDDKSAIAHVLADKGVNAWNRADLELAKTLCSESVALCREVGDQRGLAWALVWLAAAERDRGNFGEAASLFDECLIVAQAADDDIIAWCSINGLAELVFASGDYARAGALYGEAMDLARKLDKYAEGYMFVGMARLALAQGDVARAASLLETSKTLFSQAQHREGLCWVLHQLGYAEHTLGDDQRAGVLLNEALTLQHACQRKRHMTESLERAAWIAADQGRHHRSAQLFGAAASLRENIGAPMPLGDTPLHEPRLQATQSALGEATCTALWDEGRAMTLDQAVEYALSDD